MENTGVPVNVKAIEAAHKNILIDIENLEQEIQNDIKPYLKDFEKWFLWKNYSPTSSPALFKQAICETFDLDLPKTKTGNYSITKKNLESLPESIYKVFNPGIKIYLISERQNLWIKKRIK